MVGWEVVWCGDLEERVYVDFWWKGTWRYILNPCTIVMAELEESTVTCVFCSRGRLSKMPYLCGVSAGPTTDKSSHPGEHCILYFHHVV